MENQTKLPRGERGLKPVNSAECNTYNEINLNILTMYFKPNVSFDRNGVQGGAIPFLIAINLMVRIRKLLFICYSKGTFLHFYLVLKIKSGG